MLELTIILIIIAVLFVGVAWLDKKINSPKLGYFNVNLGVILLISFLLTLSALVGKIINYLISTYVN